MWIGRGDARQPSLRSRIRAYSDKLASSATISDNNCGESLNTRARESNASQSWFMAWLILELTSKVAKRPSAAERRTRLCIRIWQRLTGISDHCGRLIGTEWFEW